MRPSVLFTIRTADRTPKQNYLRRTVWNLIDAGLAADQIHVVPTDPDVSWMPPLPGVHVHVPTARRTANMNGVALVDVLEQYPADWIVLSEDDLEWCDRPLETVADWLAMHEDPDVLVYRFFAFDRLKFQRSRAACAPLREQKGSQAVALRANDARRFAAWARAHVLDWRPKGAPFQDRPHDGFDKLIGYWALQEQTPAPYGLVSQPFLVRHIGKESSLHAFGRTDTRCLSGAPS